MFYIKRLTLLIFILFFLPEIFLAETQSTGEKIKYNLGDGIINFDGKGEKNSIKSILLLTEIYCEKNNIDFKKLYLKAYPGADIKWICELKKEYTPFTVIPEHINVDLLINELIYVNYTALADELSISVYGEPVCTEETYNPPFFLRWYIYLYLGIPVLLAFIIYSYKEKIKWTFRRLRQKGYDFKTVEGCLKALEDKDELVRARAVEALSSLGNDHAIDGLIKAVEDRDPWVRKAAILELGNLKVTRAVPVLLKSLEDENYYIVSASAHSLAITGDRKIIEPLRERLKTIKASGTARDIRKAIEKLEKKEKDRRK
ncbi:MAG: HEAT repeat domain-containing protein [Candidatus Eremiobacterota bacterium]